MFTEYDAIAITMITVKVLAVILIDLIPFGYKVAMLICEKVTPAEE